MLRKGIGAFSRPASITWIRGELVSRGSRQGTEQRRQRRISMREIQPRRTPLRRTSSRPDFAILSYPVIGPLGEGAKWSLQNILARSEPETNRGVVS